MKNKINYFLIGSGLFGILTLIDVCNGTLFCAILDGIVTGILGKLGWDEYNNK